MEKRNFKDRPNAARLALSISKANSDINVGTVLHFCIFSILIRKCNASNCQQTLTWVGGPKTGE